MIALDVVSERLGSLQASMKGLEAWMSDHQETEREVHQQLHNAISAMDSKVDGINEYIIAEKARQSEHKRASGRISAFVAFVISIIVAVGGALIR